MGLHNLGVLLSDAGDREEALRVTQEATALFRRLALERPGVSASRGVFLEEMQVGDLRVQQSSVEQYRLAGTPTSFELQLSSSLFNLGRRLAEHQRWAEAVQAFEESAQRLWPYFEAHPAAFGERMRAVEWSLQDAVQRAGLR
jgi:hypothetical protein